MSRLGYIQEDISLEENKSGKFEPLNLVKIEKTRSIFFTGMENTVMGVWSSHKEGKIVGNSIVVPVKYVNLEGEPRKCIPIIPTVH